MDNDEKKKMLSLFEQVLTEHEEEGWKGGRDLRALDRGGMVMELYWLLSSEPKSDWEWQTGRILQSTIDHYISNDKALISPKEDTDEGLFNKLEQTKKGLERLYKDQFQDKEGYDNRFYSPIAVLLLRLVMNKESLWQSIEEDTLPLIDVLNICQQPNTIAFKSYGVQSATIELNSRSASILSLMIRGFLQDEIRDFHKDTTPSEMKEWLLNWHREKVDVANEKYVVGKFLKHCMTEIKWEHTHSLTDKRDIIYSIGAIAGLYEFDESKSRKERTDFVKNKINQYDAQLSKI